MHELLLHVSNLVPAHISRECRGARGQVTYWTYWQTRKMPGALSPAISCFPDAKETAIAVAVGVPEGLSWQQMFLTRRTLMMTCCVVQRQSTERGFAFSKTRYFTSVSSLNSTEQVAALAAVMGLCLLVL